MKVLVARGYRSGILLLLNELGLRHHIDAIRSKGVPIRRLASVLVVLIAGLIRFKKRTASMGSSSVHHL